jgi:Transglycosylase SLT domain
MAQQQPTQTVEDQVYAQADQLQNPRPMPQQMPPQMAQQPMPQPAQPAGITSAQSNLPTQNMAGGGIVAFAGENGSLVDDEYDPYEDDDNEEYYADIDSKNQMAKMIAQQAESSALTNALMQQSQEGQSGYGYGINSEAPSGSGIRPDAKGIAGIGFTDKLRHLESRGRDYDEKGNILTSPKGAMASMQTMPNTLKDPGFGVKPAQNNSVEEMNRVGRDYGNAMLQRYGNEKDAAMAYNWGPGNVDKWIAGGRKGPVPGETRQYASNFKQGGIVQLAGGGAVAFAEGGQSNSYFGGDEDVYSPEGVLVTGPGTIRETEKPEWEKEWERKYLKPVAPVVKDKYDPMQVSQEGFPLGGQPAGLTTPPVKEPTPAQATAEENLFKQMQKSYAEREASHKSEKELDNYLAVLQGFLGMAGGTSPYAITNLGTGFTSGIASLANARKQQGLTERGLGREQMGLFTAKQAMDRAAEDRALRKELAGNTLTERYSKDTMAQEAKKVAYIQKAFDEKGIDSQMLRSLRAKKAMGELDEKGQKRLEAYEAERKRVETEANRLFPPFVRPGALGALPSGVIKLD